VDDRGITVPQRTKEYAHDYRYFPEPDLPPLIFSPAWIEEIKAKLPQLPEQRAQRFMTEYGLSPYDVKLLTASKAMADYFEACVKLGGGAKRVANWLLGDFSRLLNATNTQIQDAKVSPQGLVELLSLLGEGKISGPGAKAIFEEMFHTGRGAKEIMSQRGLEQISVASELEGIVAKIIAANPQAVSDYQSGKSQALTFLIGQVMRETRGKANPQVVSQILKEKLG
jgi:aspartyl-tRNA(Asn)/glutamyl-tRNA(Gln) amidotransferase subunit B